MRSSLALTALLLAILSGCAGFSGRVPVPRGAPPLSSASPTPPESLPPLATYHFAFSQLALQEGKRDVALDHLKKALFYHPQSGFLTEQLGGLYFALDRLPEAEQKAEKATLLSPQYGPGWRLRGQLALYRGDSLAAETFFRRAVGADPEDDMAQYYFFRCLVRNGKVEEALKAQEAYLPHAQREVFPLLRRAQLLSDVGRHGEAMGAWKEVLTADPYNEDALQGFLAACTVLEKRKDALPLLESLFQEYPDSRDLQFALVDLYVTASRFDDAVAVLKEVYDTDLAHRPLYAWQLGRLLVDLLRLGEAGEMAQAGLEVAPLDGRLLILKAEVERLSLQEEEALKSFSLVRPGDPAWLEALFRKASLHRSRGELDLALQTLADGSGLAPAEGSLLEARIQLLQEAERGGEAEILLPLLKSVDPDSGELAEASLMAARGDVEGGEAILSRRLEREGQRLVDVLALSEVLQKANRLDHAIHILQAALARVEAPGAVVSRAAEGRSVEEAEKTITGERMELLVRIGFLYGLVGKVDDSVAWTRKILDIDPDNATALNNIGYTWVEAGRNHAEAEQMIRKALEVEPLNPSYLDSLGWAFHQQGRFQEAIPYLEQAARREPREAVILDHLASAYQGAGRGSDAISTWQRALLCIDPTRSDEKLLRESIPSRIRAAGGHP